MAVMDPVKLTITNFTKEEVYKAKKYPQDTNSTEVYDLHLDKTIYVDRQDIHINQKNDDYGIQLNKYFRIKYGPILKVISIDH